jgi:hypothetical protein
MSPSDAALCVKLITVSKTTLNTHAAVVTSDQCSTRRLVRLSTATTTISAPTQKYQFDSAISASRLRTRSWMPRSSASSDSAT